MASTQIVATMEGKEMNFLDMLFQIILPVYFAAMIGLAIFSISRSKGKIKVRIKTPYRERHKWVKPESDGKTLIIQKERKRKNIPEWKATFTQKSLVFVRRFFGLVQSFAVDVFPDATKCIEYDYDVKKISQPKFDKRTSTKFINAKVLENEGKQEMFKLPGLFWLILLLCAGSFLLSFLIANRMGVF